MKLEIVKPTTPAEKRTSSALETIEVTAARLKTWRAPPFQRPLKANDKVQALASQIQADGVIPGVLTLGVLKGDLYLLDGQHRAHAFELADIPIAYADVRFLHCESMGQMGEEFVHLNSRLVTIRPDDILRGLEGTYKPLQMIRERCKFVGYDMVRRSDKSPVLSMSTCLRAWTGSATDVPAARSVGAATLGRTLTDEESEQLIQFLGCCYQAWGRDVQYAKLWGSLNLILCAWMYRRLVISQYSAKTPRLSREQFTKCLMSLSADSTYIDWLVGRNLGERDRSPAYGKMRKVFADRIASDTGKRPMLPSPAWFGST